MMSFTAAILLVYVGSASAAGCAITMPTTEGPYYKPNAPIRDGSDVARSVCQGPSTQNGSQLMVMGRVFAAGCNQGIESILDVWSADPQGVYSPKEGPDFTCRARITTDSQGYFTFLSTVPGRYQQDMYWRPIHIHYKVTRKGDTSCILTTQQYFTSDEQYFKTDPCGLDICRPGDPTLTVPMEPAVGMDGKSYLVRFDIVLQQQ